MIFLEEKKWGENIFKMVLFESKECLLRFKIFDL